MTSRLDLIRQAESATSTVTAAEISRNFGMWQDRALGGPVIITHHGRPRVALVAIEHLQQEPGAPPLPPGQDYETRLSALVEHAWEGLLVLDANLAVREANGVFELMVGKSANQLAGRGLEGVFGSAAQFVIGEQIRRVLRTGEVIEFSTQALGPPGRHYALRAFPYAGGVGVLILNNTAEHDMTSYVQEARALEAALAAVGGVSVVRLNIRGVFSAIDDAFAALSGFGAVELAEARLTDVVRPRDRAELSHALEQVFQTGAPRRLSTTLLVKDGDERPIEVGLSAILRHGTPDGAVAAIAA